MRALGVSILLAAGLSVAAPSAAPAQDTGRVCERQPPPEKVRRIDAYMSSRRQLGFRADEAYVRKLIRKDMWQYDHGGLPVTPREDAYLELRSRLRLGSAASRYLRAHKDLDGALSIEDDWPRGPYLLQRLTRDRAKHTAALRRLVRFPRNLRTKIVPISYRGLRRIQDRVDFDAHEADGFHVSGTGADIRRSVVRIELITKRADHRAYFQAIYGPFVRTRVIGTELTVRECAELHGWRPATGPSEIEVLWEAGGGGVFAATEVAEYPDRVEVAVIGEFPAGARTSDSIARPQTVRLSAPLGDRKVVDVLTGRRLGRFEGHGAP